MARGEIYVRLPEVQYDGWPGRPPVELLHGDRAIRLAQVLAIREMMRVGSQCFYRSRVVFRDEDLVDHGIGLDIDPDRTRHVLLTQTGGTAHVDQSISFAIELVESAALEPVAAVMDHVPVRPSVAEPEPLHGLPQELDPVGAVFDRALHPGVVRRCP